jgi:hypothetical protein
MNRPAELGKQDIECYGIDARIGASGHYRAGLQRTCAMQCRRRVWCRDIASRFAHPLGAGTSQGHSPCAFRRTAIGTVLPLYLYGAAYTEPREMRTPRMHQMLLAVVSR